ncbi:MAG: hypothetical protein R3F11_02900 [Verrucomicrobiales bacterium]
MILESAGEREWLLEEVIDARDQKKVSELATAMLEKVPLTIRDSVRLHAYALDHKPRGGPRAVTPLVSIDIKPFKQRWIFGGSGAPGVPLTPEEQAQLGEDIMQLGEIVAEQRKFVSDAFVFGEESRAASREAVAPKSGELSGRERQLGAYGMALESDWKSEGLIPADDLALLGAAAAQMLESAGLYGKLNLPEGFAIADRALATLLQLRKELLNILMRGSQGGEPADPGDIPDALGDLAREAERLAEEERDVRAQLDPSAAGGTNPAATRRQQEVAVADAGELYAKLVDHPERTDGALRLMDEAERAMKSADQRLRADEPRGADPDLGTAEQRLRELAQFLRALELEQLAETLRELAQNADQGAGQAEQAGEQEAQGENGKAQAQGGSPGQGQASGQGPPPPEGSEQGGAEEPAEQLAGAARGAEMADEILGALAQRSGQAPGDEGEGEGEGAEGEGAQTGGGPAGEIDLQALRERIAAAEIARELGELAGEAAGAAGGDEGGGLGEEERARAGRAAGRLREMAGQLRAAAGALDASRLARLAEAQAAARAARESIEQAESGEGGESDAESPGQGEGKGQGQAQADLPGEGEGEGEPKGGAGGNSADVADSGSQAGGNGGGGAETEEGGSDLRGTPLGRFADVLRNTGDRPLRNIAPLVESAPLAFETLPLIEAAERRVAELIAGLPAPPPEPAAADRIPEGSRREIEDYFRDLSDDFGGEEWATSTK